MLELKVKKFLEWHSFSLEGKRIAVGVSGGPDSLALLHLFWQWREAYGLSLMALHLDHMFRGEESWGEALFVQRFCEQRNIPFQVRQADVPSYIKKSGKNPQLAARELRYQFYQEAMSEHNIEYLALGHHGDDQVETILMRLTRGSSGPGRSGMPFSRPIGNGVIIRPFLCLPKSDIEEYCARYRLEPRRDPSNDKDVYSRNRFRHKVLPFLRGENPNVHEHFQRFSEELEADERYLSELASRKMNKLVKTETGAAALTIKPFLDLPKPLQRRGIKLILNYLYGEQPSSISAVHIESIFSMLHNPHPSGTLDFPNGLKISRSYGICHFRLHPATPEPYRLELPSPGTVVLPDGSEIEAKQIQGDPADAEPANTFRVMLSETDFPLVVRTRMPGDRMTLKGMTGTRKLKDIFIDKKIPLNDRESWPVVTDRNGRILWLPGLKKSSQPDADSAKWMIELTYRQ